MLFDLHIHSSISPCSNLSLDDIVHQAQEKGLDGVCITDHDTMAAGQVIAEWVQGNGLVVIIGQEYTTRQGDFLLFGPYEDLPPGLSAEKVLSHVRVTDGAAIGAHPFRRGRAID
ncbi:MAG: PHP domain-containing protein, partial [Desulfovermiculus sp.]